MYVKWYNQRIIIDARLFMKTYFLKNWNVTNVLPHLIEMFLIKSLTKRDQIYIINVQIAGLTIN